MLKDRIYAEFCEIAKEHTGCDPRYIRNRRRPSVRAKSAVAVAMRHFGVANTVELAELLKVDHSTIVHHTTIHTNNYVQDKLYAELYDALSRHVNHRVHNFDMNDVIEEIKNIFSDIV